MIPGKTVYLMNYLLNLLLAFLVSVILIILATSMVSLADEAALWKALHSGNHFALLRHAIAPGMGDPPDFTLDKCSTQRNLSDAGRKQAKKIGERFRANGIQKALVFSSQWCRCLETAKLLKLGPVQELPALNSFFQRYELKDSQTKMLKAWLRGQDFNEPLILVTHQVNITALTSIFPASGELVIVRTSKGGKFVVVGSIKTD